MRIIAACWIVLIAAVLLLSQTRLPLKQTVAKADLDLGSFGLKGAWFQGTGTGPSRWFIRKGPAPTSTLTDKGMAFDAVMYLDSVDGKLKVRFSGGSIASLTP